MRISRHELEIAHLLKEGDRAAQTVKVDGCSVKLTPRELEIMRLVAEGKSNPEVAMILGTSPHTVRNQMRQLFQKLDVVSRSQLAVAYAAIDRARAPKRAEDYPE